MIKLVNFPYGWVCSSCGERNVYTTEIVACPEGEEVAQHFALCDTCLDTLKSKLNIRRGIENATEQ